MRRLGLLAKALLWIGAAIVATYILFGGGVLGYRVCLNKSSIMTPMQTFDMYAASVLKDIDLGKSPHRFTDKARYRARVVQLMDIYRRDCLSKVFHGNCLVAIEKFGSLYWSPDPYQMFLPFNKAMGISASFEDGQEGFFGSPLGRACVFNGEWFFD
jgi:hypothetical protein